MSSFFQKESGTEEEKQQIYTEINFDAEPGEETASEVKFHE